jgi:hypothetical protein
MARTGTNGPVLPSAGRQRGPIARPNIPAGLKVSARPDVPCRGGYAKRAASWQQARTPAIGDEERWAAGRWRQLVAPGKHPTLFVVSTVKYIFVDEATACEQCKTKQSP